MMTRFDDTYSYDVYSDGYGIFIYGTQMLMQKDPYGKLFIPDGTYEENAIAHCKSLTNHDPQPTEEEKLRSDLDYMAIMLDVDLPSEDEEPKGE